MSNIRPIVRDKDQRTALSKFLSFVLRHEPGAIGVDLDMHGWTDIEVLIARCQEAGKTITREVLEDLVATSPKQRFAISDDGRSIRANQGHSVEVDLAYEPRVPPELLFHGTVAKSVLAIRTEGLRKMDRHHVHLSPDIETAKTVAMRRGKPIILRIRAGAMSRRGREFFLSANGVWLTDEVPAEYIEFPA